MVFDTHMYLNAEQSNDDVPEAVTHVQELGATEMVAVGSDEPTIEKSLLLSQEYANIYSIIGQHLTEVGSHTPEVERRLQEQLTLSKIVVLGETGLSYYWMKDPKEVQEKVFCRQIAIVREMNLPSSVHTREALEDTYRILKDEKILDTSGITHSFSGDTEWMKKFLDLGLRISSNGVVTFKKALDVQEAAMAVPPERMSVETDVPYLAPVSYRGKQNEPGYTRYVVEKIAELRQPTFEEVVEQMRVNAHRLFRIDK